MASSCLESMLLASLCAGRLWTQQAHPLRPALASWPPPGGARSEFCGLLPAWAGPRLGPPAPRAPWCPGPWCSRGESAPPGASPLSHGVTGPCWAPTQPAPTLPSLPQPHPDQLLLHLVTHIYGAPTTLPRDRQAPPYEPTEKKPLRLQDAVGDRPDGHGPLL